MASKPSIPLKDGPKIDKELSTDPTYDVIGKSVCMQYKNIPDKHNYSVVAVDSKQVISCNKPSITLFPEGSISVVEGRNVVLPVKIIGQSSLTWYHDNTCLGSDYAHEISSDGSLTIITAEMSHSGTYRLVASNNEGAVEKQVQLSVINEEDEETLPSAVQTAEESEPIPVTGFGQYVSQNHANTNHGFAQLYKVSHYFLSIANDL